MDTSNEHHVKLMTLEAFADTIVPGRKRSSDDVVIAGVASSGGAVEAGALDLLFTEATGITEALGPLSELLNKHAENGNLTNRDSRNLEFDPSLPPFVRLSYDGRRELIRRLTAPEHPEREGWVSLALFCNMAFDSAAHMHTSDALKQRHPGLVAMGFASPDSDGVWRFREHSYGRALANVHPATTSAGDPD